MLNVVNKINKGFTIKSLKEEPEKIPKCMNLTLSISIEQNNIS